MVIRRNDGYQSAVCSQVIYNHQSRAGDTITGPEGFGAEQNKPASEVEREGIQVVAFDIHNGFKEKLALGLVLGACKE
jgi:hypothetical protein